MTEQYAQAIYCKTSVAKRICQKFITKHWAFSFRIMKTKFDCCEITFSNAIDLEKDIAGRLKEVDFKLDPF